MLSKKRDLDSPLKSLIFPVLPTPLRVQGLSFFKNALLDFWDSATKRRDPDLPPRRLNVSGTGDFVQLGMHNLDLCQSYGHLQRNDSVLDLGCGIGRTALALAKFLTDEGSYHGIDVIKFAVDWCTQHISSKRSNFSFSHADIYNAVYNSKGRLPAKDYSLPFKSKSVSFVLATSLFTHLLPDSVENYLSEIARVLKKDGHCLSSWFLIDEANQQTQARSTIHFNHVFANHAQISLYAPEQAVAYKTEYLSALFARLRLTVDGIYYGGWSGKQPTIDSGQDIIVLRQT